MNELLNNLIEAIKADNKKDIKKYISMLRRCGCDGYTIYILLNDKKIIDAKKLYNIIKNN